MEKRKKPALGQFPADTWSGVYNGPIRIETSVGHAGSCRRHLQAESRSDWSSPLQASHNDRRAPGSLALSPIRACGNNQAAWTLSLLSL